MDIKDLIVFQRVAEEGSVSRAAKSLNYVQSNVTTKIKQLEHELGVSLFHRNGRGVILNSNGKILLEQAQQILHLVEQSVKLVQINESIPVGTVTIGSINSTAAVRLPPILKQYYKLYPQVDLVVETHNSAELIRQVLSRKLDGAFVAGEVYHPEITSLLFQEEELVMISHKDFPSLEDLGQFNMLVFGDGCHYRDVLESWMEEEGIYPKRTLKFGTIEAIIGCVKAGMGIAVMVQSVLKDHQQSLYVTPLPEKYAKVPTHFIMRKDVLLSAAFRKFVELLNLSSY
ncbi:DNA-binding transcriptional LysR family regulator [Bacillus fengqiuensis]|nr:DNA-binding transcriptional LysR family regulator [Bacillus fengqiuensis]